MCTLIKWYCTNNMIDSNDGYRLVHSVGQRVNHKLTKGFFSMAINVDQVILLPQSALCLFVKQSWYIHAFSVIELPPLVWNTYIKSNTRQPYGYIVLRHSLKLLSKCLLWFGSSSITQMFTVHQTWGDCISVSDLCRIFSMNTFSS